MEREENKCCALCEHSCFTDDEDFVICDLKGKVSAVSKCRKYTYDLLKRNPRRAELPKLDPEMLLI